MGLQVLRDICANRQSSPFLTVMANETTDSSNREQITLILRRVTQELKNFLAYIYALTTAIKDDLIRMNLPFVGNVMMEQVP